MRSESEDEERPTTTGELPATACRLEQSERDGARVLRATGEIDSVTAPTLRAALLPALGQAGLVVLDLSEVSFLGSSGLAILVEARDQARRVERKLRLVCTSRIVLRALDATGLRDLFVITPDLDTALAG